MNMHDFYNKNKKLIIGIVFSAFVLILVFMSDSKKSDIISVKENYFTPALESQINEYDINNYSKTDFYNPFQNFNENDMTIAFDFQAKNLIDENIIKYFNPQCIATIVLAVDRSQTDADINGWEDAKNSNLKVATASVKEHRMASVSSIAYSIDGEKYSKYSAYRYLRSIAKNKNLISADNDSPITICFDYVAANRIKNGENLEIVVPEEGTMSFEIGILSNTNIKNIDKDKLVELGFRLIDGTCDNKIYPDDYSKAHLINDFDRFYSQTRRVDKNIRRMVLFTRFLGAGDGLGSIILAIGMIVFTVIWSFLTVHRSTRKDMLIAYLVLSSFIILWLSARLIKYIIPVSALSRFIWYSYYIFMVGLPVGLLFIVAVMNLPYPREKLIPTWYKPILAIYISLITLVLTNDIHNLVFIFSDDWENNYSYGIGYYLVFIFSFAVFLLAMFMLIVKAKKSPKKYEVIYSILVFAIILLYRIGYKRNFLLFKDSDLTIVICALSILFMETVLHAGFVPNNRFYGELFLNSPFDMQILNANGELALSSKNCEKLNVEQIEKIQSNPDESFLKDENTLLHNSLIKNGKVIWEEDITQINNIWKDIQNSIDKLEVANNLLKKDNEIKKKKVSSKIKTNLFEMLEKDIEDETKELSEIVNNLSHGEDRHKQITYVTLLMCRIKRRCNLFFLSQEGEFMQGYELAVYIDELSEFATYSDINALVKSDIPKNIPVKIAIVCYDFYFEILSWTIKQSNSTLLGQIGEKDGALLFKIWSSENIDTLEFTESLKKEIRFVNAEISYKEIDDSHEICISFSKKEDFKND